MNMKRMKIGSFLTLFLGLVALAGGMAACEDSIGEEEAPTGNDGLVTVSLAFDFASELNGYDVPRARPRRRQYCLLRGELVPPVVNS